MSLPAPDLLHGILHRRTLRRLERAFDPFGFNTLLDGLHLSAEELPGLTRERRLEGLGA